METRLFTNIPESDDELEYPHFFERFNKKMKEVFALFDMKNIGQPDRKE